jgi:signal peptidase II
LANWRAGKPAGPLSAFGLIVVALVVALDQISKALAETQLAFGEAIEILPILTLYRIHNTGIAFSFLAGLGPGLLIAVTLAVSLVVVVFWVRSNDGGLVAAAGFACILGGAIGNLTDRLRFGYVIDFLLLHVGDRTLFVFNLADAALTLGPALLLVAYLWPGGVRPSPS